MNIKSLVMMGMLGAVGSVLMILEFPLPFIPPFVKMDFSELPVIIGGFMMGPLAGIYIILIKVVLSVIIRGSVSLGVGELANVIGSISYLLPAVLIYQKKRTKKGAALGLIAGIFITSACSLISNIYFVFPAYAAVYGMSAADIVNMGAVVNPYITDLVTLLCFAILPFNLFKYGVVSVITLCIYKKLSKLLRRMAERTD